SRSVMTTGTTLGRDRPSPGRNRVRTRSRFGKRWPGGMAEPPVYLRGIMTKRRILLIEDEESISEPLAAALEREGFAARVAGTAADGLEAFRSRGPELVLLDVMLPDGDG